jgi:ribose transport system permease protein
MACSVERRLANVELLAPALRSMERDDHTSREGKTDHPVTGDDAQRSVDVDPAAEVEDRRGLASYFRITPLTVIAGAVIVLLLVSQVFITSNFFARSSLSTLTPLIGIMIIVAAGQAFVIATGGIDLSVPATITLMGAIVLKASHGQSGRLGEALLLCAVACLVIGLINGLLVEGLNLNSLVVTLAVGQLISGFTRLYRGEVPAFTEVPKNLADAAGAAPGGGVSYLLIVAVVVAIIATVFLHRISWGRRLVASSATPRAAFLVGLRARGYRILAYVIASVLYGIGGVLVAGQVGNPDLTLGDPYLLTSIVAVVLGGAILTGGRVSPIATLLGAVFITVLDYDLRVKGLSSGTRLIIQAAVLIIGLSLVYVLQNLPRIRQAMGRRAGRPTVAPGTAK